MNDLDPSVRAVPPTDDDAPIPSESEHDAALRILTDQLPTVMWKTDAELRVASVSGQAEHSLEADRASYVGRTIPDIFDGDEASPAVVGHRQALQGDRGSYALEFGGRTLQCHVEPLRAIDGSIAGVLGIGLDVTEWTEAREELATTQARYRALVEHLPAVVFIDELDDATTPVYMSPQVEELVGYTADEWVADPELWNRLLHPSDRERIEAKLREHIQTGVPLIEEYRMIHRDGRTLWVHDEARIVGGDDGTPRFSQGFLQDITARKRAEAGLRRTNQALNALIEASPLAIAAVDLEGKVTLWNPAAEGLFGWTAEEVLGRTIPTIPERARDEWESVLDAGTTGAVVSTGETRRLRKDGSFVELQIARAPIRDTSGTIVGIFGIFTDVSERKRAEEAIRASEERYRGLFENALDVVFTTDLSGRFTAVNRAAERMNGYSRDELLEMNIVDLVTPEHRHVVQRVLEMAPRMSDPEVARRVPSRYEIDVLTKSGKRRSLEAVIRLVWDGDRPVAVEGIARDVTERRRAEEALRASEERYRELFENAHDLVYTHDLEGRITSLNKAAESAIGISRERLIGVEIWKLMTPEHAELARAMLARKLAGGGPTQYEVEAVDRRGNRIPLEVNTRLVYEDGRPVAVQGVARDISERRRSQEALERSERQFRSLIENALDVIAVLDEDLTLRYGSPSLERVVGERPEELIGRSIVELLHPEDAPLVQESSQWGLAHPGETIGLEVRVRHRDGTWRVLEGIAVNLLEEPAIGGIVVNARDITERKRSEDGLRFLARASGVLSSSLDLGETLDQLARLTVPGLADWSVLLLVNEDGSRGPVFHAHVDPRKEELARIVSDRYPANIDDHPALREAVREGRSQLIQDVAPEVVDAAARDDEHRRALRELGIRSLMIVPLAARGRSLGVKILVSSESGRRFDAHDLELAEELAHRAALAVDNARLFETARESEERLRQLVEGVRDYAIFMLDPDGRIASWHPTADRTFGYREDEVIGQPVSILYGKEDALVERAQQTLEQAAEAGSVEEEGWRVRKDGTRFWAVATTTAIRDAEGRLRGFSRMTRDITERKQAQERLKRSFEMLQRTDAERRRVLARLVEAQEEERERIAVDIHDDSLQVMVAVGMRLEMLERIIRDDDARADLDQLRQVVGDSIKRLRTLLFEVRPPVLDTEGLAAALRVYARQMRLEAGIEPAIEERLSEEPPGEIGTIAYRIAAEALQNVKKHARANSVTVLLDEHDGGLRVRVVDDGVGFSKQDLEGRLPGHLGLATMRERAEVAGGWCRIETAPAKGTTVEFWLPVSRHNLSRAS